MAKSPKSPAPGAGPKLLLNLKPGPKGPVKGGKGFAPVMKPLRLPGKGRGG
jgi:hypothetical protein